ncbi:MAG: response regulator [Chloroflexota bacterium]|jgi:CheY-like chemotaxis protein
MTHILIIEDDPSMRMLLKTLLEIERFQVSVIEISSINDILSKVNEALPDIILMDINLKTADGIAALREIRSMCAGGSAARIIMTSGEDRKQECLLAGANDFLLKPYMPADLIGKLKTYST